jgi:hypothetical protein
VEKRYQFYLKNGGIENMNKMDLRILLCNHPNPKRIIIDNFSDVYKWNNEEFLFGNIVLFLEVVRQNNLWDKLEKVLEE